MGTARIAFDRHHRHDRLAGQSVNVLGKIREFTGSCQNSLDRLSLENAGMTPGNVRQGGKQWYDVVVDVGVPLLVARTLVRMATLAAHRRWTRAADEIVRTRDLGVLRGQEGARVKRAYALAAERHGIRWNGRHYDRDIPSAEVLQNQATNHAVSAMTAAAPVAVADNGT